MYICIYVFFNFQLNKPHTSLVKGFLDLKKNH